MGKEIMINFTQDMVRAILDGRKTQTRRPLRAQPDSRHCDVTFEGGTLKESSTIGGCWRVNRKWKPHLPVGSILCVRERARLIDDVIQADYVHYGQYIYEADKRMTGWVPIPDRLKPTKLGHCVPGGCFKELVRIKREVKRVWFEQEDGIWYEVIEFEGIE